MFLVAHIQPPLWKNSRGFPLIGSTAIMANPWKQKLSNTQGYETRPTLCMSRVFERGSCFVFNSSKAKQKHCGGFCFHTNCDHYGFQSNNFIHTLVTNLLQRPRSTFLTYHTSFGGYVGKNKAQFDSRTSTECREDVQRSPQDDNRVWAL